jgi:hypothetical protein
VSLSAEAVRRAHERIGRADEVVEQRRALYATVIELEAAPGEELSVDADVLDNPVVRGHLGEVLGGRTEFSRDQLGQLTALVAPDYVTDIRGHTVRLASAPGAEQALEGVLRRVGDELRRQGDDNIRLRLVTTASRDELDEANRHLIEGLRLAVRWAPDLALDLLPHVSLFAVVDGGEAGRLGSASAREFPGVVLIPQPRTPLEVAEAFVHEGAHSKFFDFGTTRRMLGALSASAPRFMRSWAPPGAPSWPLEQSIAAWHAYRCLDVFGRYLDVGVPLHDDSLLPAAATRADEIGEWLRSCGRFLGADAHELIAHLDGSRPSDAPPAEEADLSTVEQATGSGDLLVRRAGSRTLVAKRGTPPELYWMQRR